MYLSSDICSVRARCFFWDLLKSWTDFYFIVLTSRAISTLALWSVSAFAWWLVRGLSLVSSNILGDMPKSSANWSKWSSMPSYWSAPVRRCLLCSLAAGSLSWVYFCSCFSLFSISLLMYASSTEFDWLKALLVVSSIHFIADLLTECNMSKIIAQKSSIKKEIPSQSGLSGSSYGFRNVSSKVLKLWP